MTGMRMKQQVNSYGADEFIFTNVSLLRKPFRNFEGRPSKIRPNGGIREFCMIIDNPEYAQKLAEFGFNVKTLTNRDGIQDEELHYLAVRVAYYDRYGEPVRYPPKFKIFTANNECYYEEQNIKELDSAELADVKLKFTAHYNKVGDKEYQTPYLNSFQATMVDDFMFDEDDDMPFDIE